MAKRRDTRKPKAEKRKEPAAGGARLGGAYDTVSGALISVVVYLAGQVWDEIRGAYLLVTEEREHLPKAEPCDVVARLVQWGNSGSGDRSWKGFESLLNAFGFETVGLRAKVIRKTQEEEANLRRILQEGHFEKSHLFYETYLAFRLERRCVNIVERSQRLATAISAILDVVARLEGKAKWDARRRVDYEINKALACDLYENLSLDHKKRGRMRVYKEISRQMSEILSKRADRPVTIPWETVRKYLPPTGNG